MPKHTPESRKRAMLAAKKTADEKRKARKAANKPKPGISNPPKKSKPVTKKTPKTKSSAKAEKRKMMLRKRKLAQVSRSTRSRSSNGKINN